MLNRGFDRDNCRWAKRALPPEQDLTPSGQIRRWSSGIDPYQRRLILDEFEFLLNSAAISQEVVMPIFLEPRDAIDELKQFGSVLIVSCPVCPPMCVSIQKKQPFIEFFKHGLKTNAFEAYIESIRNALVEHGVRTDAFTMWLPVPMMCLWTGGQRQHLLRRAREFEAVLVLGCDSATHTAADALRDTGCDVFQGMTVKTITNATAKFRFPGTAQLEWHPLPTKPRIGQFNAPAEDSWRKSVQPD